MTEQREHQLHVGAAEAIITPPVGTPMDGYSSRQGVATGVHDDLHARALVLDDGRSRLATVSCDLVGVDRRLVARARELVQAATGIEADHVMVAATHTHSGPGGLRRDMDEPLIDVTARQIAGAVGVADTSKQPAVLKVGYGTVDSVSQNRRHPDWPIQTRLTVLLADSPDPLAPPVAALVNFACHATVMNYDNLLISADYPGHAVGTVQKVIPGLPCVFLNGACGNVNPVWIQQRFPEPERVGSIVGAEAAKVIQELRPLGHGQPGDNIRWSELTEKPVTAGVLLDGARLRAASRRVQLPLRPLLSDGEYEARLADLAARLEDLPEDAQPDERHRIMQELNRYRTERMVAAGMAAAGGGRTHLRPEVQAFSLAPGAAILGLPGEFFVETGQAIEEAAGLRHLLLGCYANHYVGYVVPPEAYEQGGYEAGVTIFAPEAEGIIVREALAVLGEAASSA